MNGPQAYAPVDDPSRHPPGEVSEAADLLKDADVYNVRVPAGGFLAIVYRGKSTLSSPAVERIEMTVRERFGVKACVFCGDFALVGVGPEGKEPE